MSPKQAPAAPPDNKVWIDRAKGICIILVVMMHTALGVEKVLGHTGYLHSVVAWTKPFRMPDFFLLSGYLAGSVGALPWRDFFDRRILHYTYFYLLWLAILTALKLVTDGAFSIEGYIHSFATGLIEPFGTLWFIHVLPFFMLVARFARGSMVWIIAMLAVVLHVWAAAYPDGGAFAMSSHVFGWIAPDSFALFLFFFLSGYFGRDLISRIAHWARREPLASMLVLVLWAVLHSLVVGAGLAGVTGLTMVLGLMGGLAIVTLAVLIERFSIFGWLAYCGRHSLAIYLAFVVPMSVSRSLLVGKFGVTQPDIVMICVLSAAILVPLVLERLVQSGPLGFLFTRPQWARLRRAEDR